MFKKNSDQDKTLCYKAQGKSMPVNCCVVYLIKLPFSIPLSDALVFWFDVK